MVEQKMCPNCLAPFPPHNSLQIFCSKRCGDAYQHKAQRRLAQARNRQEYHSLWQKFFRYHKPIDGYPEKNCPGCGAVFIPITSTQLYCCKRCGDRARRKDTARQQKYKEQQTRYSNSSPRHFINRLLNKKSRNRHLDIDYVMKIYDAQEGRCALSGVKMTHIAGQGRIPTNISIDRIDSTKGYEEGNIQLLCCAVNIAKSNWGEDIFIDLCRKIVKKADSNPRDNSKRNLRVMSKSANAGRRENSRKRGSGRSKSKWGV